MATEHLLEDVQNVNLSYLLLMQRLINTDRELAMFRLKIDADMADLLSTIPVPELAKLAQCNQLLCHFSLGNADQLYSLVNASKDDDMRRVHAAIMLSSQDDDGATPPDGVERRRATLDFVGRERRKSQKKTAAKTGPAAQTSGHQKKYG